MSSDALNLLAIEILKAKYDLQSLSVEEILNAYLIISSDIEQANKAKPRKSSMNILK